MTTPAETLAAQLHSLRIDKDAPPPAGTSWRWPVLGAVLAVAGIAFFVWRHNRPPLVETAFVIRQSGAGGATAVLTGGGYIVTKDQVVVSAEVAGRVVELNFDRGDRVKKGQWLARLDGRDYEVARQRAAAERLKAEAEIGLAQSQVKRQKDLVSQKIGSQEKLDEAQRALQLGQAAIAMARANEAAAQLDLERTLVRAPFDGTVLERLIQVGETARPGFGGEGNKVGVAKLADLSDLEVEVDITERDLAKVREGQRCLVVVDAYPERKYEGYVRLRAPEANRQKSVVQAKVKIEVPDEFLRPEMNAQVTFYDGRPDAAAPTVILVPKKAVVDNSVYVLKEGIAVNTPFTPDGEQGDNFKVRAGLSGGEEVILDPQAKKIRSGQKVRLPEAGKE